MSDLAAVKAVALLGIGFVTFGGAYLPYWLKRRNSAGSHTQSIVAISHNLAGGVFVSASLMHLVPNAAAYLPLRIVLILVTAGAIFADLVESIAVPSSSDFLRSSVFADLKSVVYVPEQTYPDKADPFSDSLLAHLRNDFHSHDDNDIESGCDSKLDETLTGSLHGRAVHHHHIQIGGTGLLSWLVFSMLSLHAMVTGAAFGMTTGLHDTFILGVVIFAHKGVESFAVAFNFAEGSPERTSTIALILYGLMTPFGAVLAVGAQHFITSDVALIVQDVLESFAAGSFLYVGMMHLQNKTCCRLGWLWAKALPELFGAGIMVAVSFWI